MEFAVVKWKWMHTNIQSAGDENNLVRAGRLFQ